MKPTAIRSTDLRLHTREIIERVKFRGEQFLVHTFGQPSAMIISVEEYMRLKKAAQASLNRLNGKSEGIPDEELEDNRRL